MRLPRPRRTAVLAAAAAIAVVVPTAGLTAAYAYAGDVPRRTTVLGVELGGMSRAEAAEALRAGLAEHAEALAAPVEVRVGDVPATLDPAEVGLAVDVAATVAAAAGAGHPLTAVFGARAVDPVVTVDTARLGEVLGKVAEEAGEAMTQPRITFDGTTPVPVYPEPGLGLDPEVAAAALAAGWPRLDTGAGQWRKPPVVGIPLTPQHPVTTAAEVDRLVAELAEPAVAAPVTVTIPEGGSIEAVPAAIAASLRLTADERGEIVPRIKRKALRKALADPLAEVETAPVDATVVLEGGEPAVVEARAGTRVDAKELAGALLAVLPDPAPRTVPASLATVEPEVTTQDVADLGIQERVSSFTTDFDGGLESPRSQNIVKMAELVDGVIVQPDEVFSLNGHTGERGYAQGFQDAPVIIGGKLVPAVGGGNSQFTTTLFNAAYYAGLEDVEHHPHSYHYSRYPPVIESTIFYPDLDLKFRNDTRYGILIDTSYTSGSITVSMWSTQVWDEVRTEWGGKREITSPRTEYLEPGPSCIATSGINGFTQDAWRIFVRDGEEVRREQFTWRYDAQPEFICDEEPDGDDR